MWNFVLCKKLIEETGLRRDFVADKAGIKHSSLSKYLQGYGKPGQEAIDALARLFKVDPKEMSKPAKRIAG